MKLPDAEIVYWDIGYGTKRDAAIVESVLSRCGFIVGHSRIRDMRSSVERRRRFITRSYHLLKPLKLQIHLEQVHREQFLFARNNLLIPNPEFFDPDVLGKLRHLRGICCKTKHAQDLFGKYGVTTHLTGFTSIDQYSEVPEKDYKKILHIAGKSDWKGTEEVLQLWRAHPEWPELTVVWSPLDSYGNPRRSLPDASNIRILFERLPESELRDLINSHGVHLCPSKTEGFGHYIVEALSAGAIVISTDAPPMNELVQPEFGYLAKARPEGSQFMSTLYRVEVESLGKCVEEVLKEPRESLEKMSALARAWFLENDKQFKENFARLLEQFYVK